MTAWTSDELSTIGAAEEMEIAPRRDDGTLRRPVPIWLVRLGDDLYIRSVNGRDAAWFKGTQVRHQGHIEADGTSKDVAFEDVTDDATLKNQIDTAYRTKYRRYAKSIVNSVVSPRATAATLRVVPQS